jgi:N-acetyl-anhydromuramyl-L-alanine amidase AmpD
VSRFLFLPTMSGSSSPPPTPGSGRPYRPDYFREEQTRRSPLSLRTVLLATLLCLGSFGLAGVLADRFTGSDRRTASPFDHLQRLLEQGRTFTRAPQFPWFGRPEGPTRQIFGSQNVACPGLSPVQPAIATQIQSLRVMERPYYAHPSNRGYRERVDRSPLRRPVAFQPGLIVLHETVYSVESAINTFRTPHTRDEDQVSYHLLIGRDGALYRIVPDEQRAFGAGNSEFHGLAVRLNPALDGSVNNIALHVSLETPEDGQGRGPGHSGYTGAQYAVLAQVVGDWMQRWRIPATRIASHAAIDRDGERSDPRSFDAGLFYSYLSARLGQPTCPGPLPADTVITDR